MSALSERLAPGRTRPRLSDSLILAALILGATALSCLMNMGLITETWRGRLSDPDDAMRLVEVRAWLAGQSWYDMTAMRLDPPLGSIMHWSRLVDLPLALLVKLFGLVTDATSAERLALIAVPTLWLATLYLGMARLAILLVGPAGRTPALIGTILSGAALVQFAPGRIGHHAPETVALVFAIGAALAALDPRRASEGAVAGLLVALSLSMSLETLPFHAALASILLGLWVWRGAAVAPALTWFGGGLILSLPAFYILTVAPSRWFVAVCDAYGPAHLGAGLIGALGMVFLARSTRLLQTRTLRSAGAGAVALLAIAYVAITYPTCLHSPFAGVDPLVRSLWLDHVTESLSLPAFLRAHPSIGFAIIIPLIFGLVGQVIATLTSRDGQALRFAALAILSAFGLALGCWQVRALGATTPLALLGGVFLVVKLQEWFASRGLPIAALLTPAAIIVFASTFWIVLLPSIPLKSDGAIERCLAPNALRPLASLPSGSAVGPINIGSHLLEATKLSVFAAPYHRNDDGNRFAFDVLMASFDAAHAKLSTRHVDYVVLCPGTSDLRRLIDRAPDGFAARLLKGDVPTFLVEQHLGGTPYKVYSTNLPVR